MTIVTRTLATLLAALFLAGCAVEESDQGSASPPAAEAAQKTEDRAEKRRLRALREDVRYELQAFPGTFDVALDEDGRAVLRTS